MTPTRYPPYPNYRDSGVEWLGEIPSHWEVMRLKTTVEGCINGTWGDEPDEGVNNLICVRVADFDRVGLKVGTDNLTVRSIPENQKRGKLLQSGDLLIEKSGGGEQQLVGAVVLFDLDIPAVCSNFIARMPVRTGREPSYLNYLHFALYAARIN